MMKHIAFIPDGHRHWAKEKGLPAVAGYPHGIKTIEQCCAWAIKNNIPYISFYCFSTENFERRPKDIVDYFIALAVDYAAKQTKYYVDNNIKVVFNGRRDRLPNSIIAALEQVEIATKDNTGLTLMLCCDYGGRNEIVQAIQAGAKTEEELNNFMCRYTPDPDAIVRTSGVKRLSNFLLWQSAYSELFFIDKYFPDLTEADLDQILNEFNHRSRSFGG